MEQARQLGAPPDEAPPGLAGSSRFRAFRKLGQGGMGAVYRAEQVDLARPVVLKVIRSNLVGDTEAVDRFKREARAAAQLSHPNIVKVFEAGEENGLHFIVMELVEGIDLFKLTQERIRSGKGLLPIYQACLLARQVALGLQHAHEKGVLHRDIKPANVIVSRKGLVTILDFGLARLSREKRGSEPSTVANAMMGTPDYMAPEQARDAHSVDVRADIYSLGCTLYFLLTGRPPFQRSHYLDVLLAHAETPPPSLSDMHPDTPAELDAIVAKMLAKDPADRYQTPGEVARALLPLCARKEGVADSGPVAAETIPPVEGHRQTQIADHGPFTLPPVTAAPRSISPRRRARKRPSRRRWLFSIGLAALVSTAAVVVSFLPRAKEKEGKLILRVEQAGAAVALNGEPLDALTPGEMQSVEIDLEEAEYLVRVTKDGFTAWERAFTATASEPTVFDVRLEPERVEPPTAPKQESTTTTSTSKPSAPPVAAAAKKPPPPHRHTRRIYYRVRVPGRPGPKK